MHLYKSICSARFLTRIFSNENLFDMNIILDENVDNYIIFEFVSDCFNVN